MINQNYQDTSSLSHSLKTQTEVCEGVKKIVMKFSSRFREHSRFHELTQLFKDCFWLTNSEYNIA